MTVCVLDIRAIYGKNSHWLTTNGKRELELHTETAKMIVIFPGFWR
jgi:hypothetical protein